MQDLKDNFTILIEDINTRFDKLEQNDGKISESDELIVTLDLKVEKLQQDSDNIQKFYDNVGS